jgi:glyoxylase-like metal-dependent hydrolase (beta-lactamase superfamily II)
VKNNNAILIDFGAGGILDALSSIGIHSVDWILHTHFHRDQAQGDANARAKGIKIAIPAAEKQYFENVEDFWTQKKIFLLYDMRNEFLALRQNLAVDFYLEPNTTFSWNGLALRILSTPGHTQGSLSFLLESGKDRMLFCGDLLGSAGKVPTMHDLEWPYVGTTGIEAQMNSINFQVRGVAPTIVLPSHGTPSREPLPSTATLLADLATIYTSYNWAKTTQWRPGFIPRSVGPAQLTKHVWQMRQVGFSHGVGYLIVADSGKAMLWDINAGETDALADMKQRTGFTSIELVGASHYHEDHVGGINTVKKTYGAKFWAMEHMVDVLEHPAAYNLPCLWPEPILVDRVLHDGEKVMWEGISMQFLYLPGQTEYTEGLLIELDGKRLLFDGDNVAHPVQGSSLYGHYVCRNFQRLSGGHMYSSKRILELMPDFLCPQHFEWNTGTREHLESYLTSSRATNDAFRRIIDQPDPQIGVDNNWASLYPYQYEAEPGSSLLYQLRIRNWLDRGSRLRAGIRLPDQWSADPPVVEVSVRKRSCATVKFQVHIPVGETRVNRRFVVTADLWRDGEHLGELTEGLINMRPMKAH